MEMTLDFQWKMRKITPPVWVRRLSRIGKSCLARSGRTPDAADFGDCPSTRHQQWQRKGYRRVTKKPVISRGSAPLWLTLLE